MTWVEIIFLIIMAALFVLPPEYDPAIRLKEWLEKKGGKK